MTDDLASEDGTLDECVEGTVLQVDDLDLMFDGLESLYFRILASYAEQSKLGNGESQWAAHYAIAKMSSIVFSGALLEDWISRVRSLRELLPPSSQGHTSRLYHTWNKIEKGEPF